MGWMVQRDRVWMVRERGEGWGDGRDESLVRGRGTGKAPTRKTAGSAPAPAGDLPSSLTEDDLRERRMDRVAVLYGEITAATRAFLAAVAECDRHRDWEHAGFGSCAEWLAWRLGVTRNTANEKVRAARALEDLPLTSEAMARGELSFSKVRALTRAATPDNESELLELARAGSADNLERVIRGWKRLDDASEARRERALYRSRRFSIFPDGDGMYVVKGRLTPEVATVLMRAVEAASDALFKEAWKGGGGARKGGGKAGAGEARNGDVEVRQGEGEAQMGEGEARAGAGAARTFGGKDPEKMPDPTQLRADALGLLAQRALAAGFKGKDAPVSGTKAERYQVMLHVEEKTLTLGTGAPRDGGSGLSELNDGTRVTAETARRLSCDAAKVVVRTNPDGTIIDAGRRTRTIPPATRRALEARDRGCRFPGCGIRFTDGHHIVHWADGGATTLKNLVLLCERHHRRVHEEGYQVCSGADGKIVFFTPGGPALYDGAPPPELPADPVKELVQGNRERGVVPDEWAAAPAWHRDRDIPWEIEAAARVAMDPWEKEDEEDEPEEPAGGWVGIGATSARNGVACGCEAAGDLGRWKAELPSAGRGGLQLPR